MYWKHIDRDYVEEGSSEGNGRTHMLCRGTLGKLGF